MAQVTPIVRRIPSLISGLSIDSGMTLKTCGLREDVDTVALGLDRRKIAKSSLPSKYFFLMCLCLSVRSDAERCQSLPTDSYPRARAANLSHLSHVSSVDQRLQRSPAG